MKDMTRKELKNEYENLCKQGLFRLFLADGIKQKYMSKKQPKVTLKATNSFEERIANFPDGVCLQKRNGKWSAQCFKGGVISGKETLDEALTSLESKQSV